jgi:hypothetical protein
MTDKPERWTVHTERAKEAPRVGIGEQDLRLTLQHLRMRGDKACQVSRGGRPSEEHRF